MSDAKWCAHQASKVVQDDGLENISAAAPLVKHDTDKADFSLLPLWALEGVVRVMMYGAKKYSRDGWRKGRPEDARRYLAAALRHLGAINRDANVLAKDDESGLPHLDHATCSLMMARGIYGLEARPANAKVQEKK